MAVTLTFLLFWICFFLVTLVFVLQWLSLHWEILIMLSHRKWGAPFHDKAYEYSGADWEGLYDHLKDV